MRRFIMAGLALLMLAGCARTSGTVEIPPDELPFPVAREPSAVETPAPLHPLTIFFARAGRLARVEREVDVALPDAEAAVRALLDGPSRRERSSGITTELVAGVRLLTVDVSSGTASVDLSGEFQEPAPSDRIALRVAQVVWTLTAVAGVDAVRFSIDGDAVAVTTPDGTLLERPVNRADYASLAPPG